MDPYDVGDIRFCWACGREAILLVEDRYDPSIISDEDISDPYRYRCICCHRPFNVCPCTPFKDGECKSINEG